jgi:hypothetical protein
MHIYKSQERMDAHNTSVDSSKGIDQQCGILLHWHLRGGSEWSGGMGCQLSNPLYNWAKGKYDAGLLDELTGHYYLVDMNGSNGYKSLEENK